MSDPFDPPLAQRIAASIVDRIAEGRLAPGDRIVEQAIADEFGTSRGPVRDALRILSTKKWIDIVPHHGARVAGVDTTPSAEKALISAAVFGLACRFALGKAREADIDRICDRIKAIIALAHEDGADPATFTVLARGAGQAIVALAANPQIADLIGPIPQDALAHHGRRGVQTQADRLKAAEIWIELGTALRLRDADAAERAGRRLVESSLRRIIASELSGAAPKDPAETSP